MRQNGALVRQRYLLVPCAIVLLTICSCSFAKPEGAASGKPADYPDTSMLQATYVMGQAGQQPLRIKSDLIEIYQNAKVAYLENIEFEQHDDDGNLLVTGTADKAKIDMDKQDALIQGNVVVNKLDDNMTIVCEELTWTDSLQIIEVANHLPVTVTYGDANKLVGRGFTGYMKEAIFEFSEIDEGYLIQ